MFPPRKKRTASGDVRRLWAKGQIAVDRRRRRQMARLARYCGARSRRQADLQSFQRWVKDNGFTRCGAARMGGSSLGAEVLNQVFGSQSGWPKLHVLDFTDPAQIRSVETPSISRRRCFIVSSKSGTTLEPNILMDYFFAKSGSGCGEAVYRHHRSRLGAGEARARQKASRTSFTAIRKSAAAIRCCRNSA